MTVVPQIAFEGMAPPDPDELRLFCVSWCEREGERAQPLGSGGVALLLHPAADPLRLEWDERGTRGTAITGTCGPGFHEAVCQLLKLLKQRFTPDLRVSDETGYFESQDRAALERAMIAWRVRAGRMAAQVLSTRGGPILFGLPPNAEHAGKKRRRVITALGVHTASEWRHITEEVERGHDLELHFPWWSPDKDARYWLNRGLAYLNVRRLEGRADDNRLRRAIDACARAKELDSALPMPDVRLASACEQLERWEDALRFLKAAIERDPSLFDLYPWLARVYERLGLHEEAARELESLSARCPTLPEVAYEAGFMLNAVEEFERAQPLLDRAVKLRPKKAKYHGELAVTLAALGRHEEALAALDRALAREPDNLPGLENRVILLEVLGRAEEAAEARARLEGLSGGGDGGD